MAKKVITAAYIALGGVDYSANFAKIELTIDVEDKDATTFGSGGWKEVLGGIKSGSIALTFKNDMAAAAFDSAFFPLLGTVVTFEVRVDQAVVGTSNPKYTGNVLINGHKPIAGSVGDINEADLDMPTSGAITRATA